MKNWSKNISQPISKNYYTRRY